MSDIFEIMPRSEIEDRFNSISAAQPVPIASTNQAGIVEIGNGINVDPNGVISVTIPQQQQVGSILFLYNNAWGGF